MSVSRSYPYLSDHNSEKFLQAAHSPYLPGSDAPRPPNHIQSYYFPCTDLQQKVTSGLPLPLNQVNRITWHIPMSTFCPDEIPDGRTTRIRLSLLPDNSSEHCKLYVPTHAMLPLLPVTNHFHTALSDTLAAIHPVKNVLPAKEAHTAIQTSPDYSRFLPE